MISQIVQNQLDWIIWMYDVQACVESHIKYLLTLHLFRWKPLCKDSFLCF